MSGHVKKSDGWNAVASIPGKLDTGLKDMVSGWHKTDAGWIRVWSSGSLIEFYEYTYPIPVMAGWEYSTDGGISWIKIEDNGEIQASGVDWDFSNATLSNNSMGWNFIVGSVVGSKPHASTILFENSSVEFPVVANYPNKTYSTNKVESTNEVIILYDKNRTEIIRCEFRDGLPVNPPAVIPPFTGLIRTKRNLELEDYSNSKDGARIPITAGSTHNLEGEAETSELSEVLIFDHAVSGTIKYQSGDMAPSAVILIRDANGNIIEDAEITFQIGDWNFNNISIRQAGGGTYWAIEGYTGTSPVISRIHYHFTSGDTVRDEDVAWIMHYPTYIYASMYVGYGEYPTGAFDFEFFDADNNSLGTGSCSYDFT